MQICRLEISLISLFQILFINLNTFWFRIHEGWAAPKSWAKKLKNKKFCPDASHIHGSGWGGYSFTSPLLPRRLPETRSLLFFCSCPSICQITSLGEVNRQNSTSSALSPPRDGEEMKASEMTAKRRLNVSRHKLPSPRFLTGRPRRFIYSGSGQNSESPRCRKSDGTAQCRHAQHGLAAVFAPQPGT